MRGKSYSLTYNRIYGYGRPDWSLVPDTTTETEDDDMDINRFKELWHEMRKEWRDNDASDYSQEARDGLWQMA